MVRLYLAQLSPSPFDLDKDHAHYLKNVLRLQINDTLHVFNEGGEWRAQILELKKNHATIKLVEKVRESHPLPFVGLAFAPLKHDAQHFLLEKAAELGATDLYPVITQRSNVHRVSIEKWVKNTIEATQQCERLSPPILHDLQSLDQFLKNLGENHHLLVARERGDARPITSVLSELDSCQKCIFLIGPEGGFTPEEFHTMARRSKVHFITLGPRILRAETAALASLACFQSLLGDWQRQKNLSR